MKPKPLNITAGHLRADVATSLQGNTFTGQGCGHMVAVAPDIGFHTSKFV